MQRPDIIGHQRFADSFDGERLDCAARRSATDGVLRIAHDQTAENGDGHDNTAPVNAAVFSDVAPGQKNGENNQDRDRADIDEYLHQPDKLRAEQKEKRGDADERNNEAQARRE